jgi:hypothetical protein
MLDLEVAELAVVRVKLVVNWPHYFVDERTQRHLHHISL